MEFSRISSSIAKELGDRRSSAGKSSLGVRRSTVAGLSLPTSELRYGDEEQ